jgi:hypothetical protein
MTPHKTKLLQLNEAAWLWLSSAVETDDERIGCLEKALEINPANDAARRGLEHLQAARRERLLSTVSQLTSQAEPGTTTPIQASAQSSAAGRTQVAKLKASPPRGIRRGYFRRLLNFGVGLLAFAIFCAVGTWLVGGFPSRSAWEEFTSEKGRFSILMPGKPKSQIIPVSTQIGTINVHALKANTGGFTYMVGYADYPEAIVQSAMPGAMLSGARDGAVANVQGKLIDERAVSLRIYPGRELKIEATEGSRMVMIQARIYLVNTRFYQVMVIGAKDRFSESNADAYLDSFKLLDR